MSNQESKYGINYGINIPDPLPLELPIGTLFSHNNGIVIWETTQISKKNDGNTYSVACVCIYTDEDTGFYVGGTARNGHIEIEHIDWGSYYQLIKIKTDDFWTDWGKRNPGYDIETMKRLYGDTIRFSMEEPK